MTRPPSNPPRGYLLGVALLTFCAQLTVGLTCWALGAGWLVIGAAMAVTGCVVAALLLLVGTR